LWDEARQSPHVSFEADGKKTELWFENARSLRTKMELARQMGFRGISAWVAGQEDPAFWDMLDDWTIVRPRGALAGGSLEQRSKKAAKRL
jgi:spore germination protein YaaH